MCANNEKHSKSWGNHMFALGRELINVLVQIFNACTSNTEDEDIKTNIDFKTQYIKNVTETETCL